MAYSADSFVADEQPTTSKWNKLWSNDAAFNNGSGIGDNAIINRHYADASIDPAHHANRTRRVLLQLKADETGGAVADNNEGPAVAFTGTPTGYARAGGIVPADYASGDASIIAYCRSSATNSSETVQHFISCRSIGDVHSSWNIASGVTQTNSFSTTWSAITLATAIPDANIDALDYVAVAINPITALSGTVYIAAIVLEYTSNS